MKLCYTFTFGDWATLCWFVGTAWGVLLGAWFWRGQAVQWRNSVGYMGRKDHK